MRDLVTAGLVVLVASWYFCEYSEHKTLRRLTKIYKPKASGEAVSLVEEFFDPFVKLSYFNSSIDFQKYSHKCLGIVTYVEKGSLEHESFKGHCSNLSRGSVEWITSGKGIVYAEQSRFARGFQAWVLLESSYCQVEPKLSYHTSEEVFQKGSKVTTIPKHTTPVLLANVEMEPGSYFEQTIHKGWNALLYLKKGKVYVESDELKQGEVSILTRWDSFLKVETKEQSASFILAAGQPFDTVLVKLHNFFGRTYSEVHKATEEYKQAKRGFEGAEKWKPSCIKT